MDMTEFEILDLPHPKQVQFLISICIQSKFNANIFFSNFFLWWKYFFNVSRFLNESNFSTEAIFLMKPFFSGSIFSMQVVFLMKVIF
jgi:hypothetical protein